jgi:hydrogenase expression/formation protein HypD
MEIPSSEFRNPELVRALAREIREIPLKRPIRLMEVCGGQTHTIYRYQLRHLLPSNIRLISGPGCPVCVTPISYLDKALELCRRPDVELFTFGDLLRVPGSRGNLEQARAQGAKVHVAYSPFQALEHARTHPQSQVVFLGIGFETTLPSFSLPLREAIREDLPNFSVLVSAKRVPPLLAALLRGKAPIDGFVTPGHVTSIIGANAYADLCQEHRVPMAVGGFEPVDLMLAIRGLVRQIEAGTCENNNAYARAASVQGNRKAQQLIEELYEPCDEELRGLGTVPEGGYRLRTPFARYDAAIRFSLEAIVGREPPGCRCGEILSGTAEPAQCPLFGKACTPDRPVGACMVSNEGTCNAAFLYRETA